MKYGDLCISGTPVQMPVAYFLTAAVPSSMSILQQTSIHEHPPTDFKCTCLIFKFCCGFLITHSWTDCRIYFVSVGDIPGPPRSQRSGVTRRAQSREELSSTGGSSHPLRPQTRTVSRSISVSVLQTNYTVQNIF